MRHTRARSPRPVVPQKLIHLRDAADVSRLQLLVRRSARAKDDPEQLVSLEAVVEHLAVPRLEDVQRERGPGKEDLLEREEREKTSHG